MFVWFAVNLQKVKFEQAAKCCSLDLFYLKSAHDRVNGAEQKCGSPGWNEMGDGDFQV